MSPSSDDENIKRNTKRARVSLESKSIISSKEFYESTKGCEISQRSSVGDMVTSTKYTPISDSDGPSELDFEPVYRKPTKVEEDAIYDGEWLDGKKHGRGKQVWPNGDVYDGQWLDNYAHGEGTMYFTKNKRVHKGSYHEGV